VIEIRGVSKVFRIPHHARRTLFHRVFAGEEYTFETFHALKDVSLRVAAGEFVGILGPNGSGKSTLLRIVAGIYKPSAGEVRVEGPVAPILDLGIGFVGALPVWDNVVLYGVLLGIPRRRVLAELPAILAAAGVERFADAALDTLSTGMRARLAYVVALRAEAPLLLVDEALAVGDREFQDRCRAELRGLRGRGRSALLVSHDESLLHELCDRLVVLHGGTVRGEGPPDEMIGLYRSL
jgi:ABC-type polysaccharide/polyol phosphate transport system ATPase subunit